MRHCRSRHQQKTRFGFLDRRSKSPSRTRFVLEQQCCPFQHTRSRRRCLRHADPIHAKPNLAQTNPLAMRRTSRARCHGCAINYRAGLGGRSASVDCSRSQSNPCRFPHPRHPNHQSRFCQRCHDYCRNLGLSGRAESQHGRIQPQIRHRRCAFKHQQRARSRPPFPRNGNGDYNQIP